MDEAFNSGDEHLKALAKVKYALNKIKWGEGMGRGKIELRH